MYCEFVLLDLERPNEKVSIKYDCKIKGCMFCDYDAVNKYILLDILLRSIAEYFYKLCRILMSP